MTRVIAAATAIAMVAATVVGGDIFMTPDAESWASLPGPAPIDKLQFGAGYYVALGAGNQRYRSEFLLGWETMSEDDGGDALMGLGYVDTTQN